MRFNKKRVLVFVITILFCFNISFSSFKILDKNVKYHQIGVVDVKAVVGVDDAIIIGGFTVTASALLKLVGVVLALSGVTYVAGNHDLIAENISHAIQTGAIALDGLEVKITSAGKYVLSCTQSFAKRIIDYFSSNPKGSAIKDYKNYCTFSQIANKPGQLLCQIQLSDFISCLTNSDGTGKTVSVYESSNPIGDMDIDYSGYASESNKWRVVAQYWPGLYKNAITLYFKYYVANKDEWCSLPSCHVVSDEKAFTLYEYCPQSYANYQKNFSKESDCSIPVSVNYPNTVSVPSDYKEAESATDYVVTNATVATPEVYPSTSTSDDNIPILGNIWDLIKKILSAILDLPKLIGHAVSDALSWIADSIVNVGKTIVDGVVSALDGLKSIVQDIPSAVSSAFNWLKDLILDIPSAISSAFSWVGDKIGSIAGNVASAIADVFSPVISFVNDFFGAPTVDLNVDCFKNITVTNKFPFSIPWDVYNSIYYFFADGVAPKIPLTFNDITFATLDFSQFEELCKIIRFFIYALFLFGLIKCSKKLIN